MRADNMPHNSREVTISPLLVTVTGTNIAQGSVLQGTTNFPLLSIHVTPSINQVVISTLTLTIGTVQSSIGIPPNRIGDGDFTKLYVYVDTNLDGQIDPGDTLVGSVNWGLGTGFRKAGRPSFLSVRPSPLIPQGKYPHRRRRRYRRRNGHFHARPCRRHSVCHRPSRSPCSRPALQTVRRIAIRSKALPSRSTTSIPYRSQRSPCGRISLMTTPLL